MIISLFLGENYCLLYFELTKGFANNNKMDIPSPIWFNIHVPTQLYVGRETELRNLDEFWNRSSSSKKALQMVAITGLGGVGKTELAVNYAVKFRNEEEGHCIMIDAETTCAAFESLGRLSRELGILVKDFEKEENGLEILVKEVYKRLSSKKCLIILDNLESYKADIVNAFRANAKNQSSSRKPFFLLTTRSRQTTYLVGIDVEYIELDVLSKDFSENFLITALEIKDDDVNCKELIKRLSEQLQGHPLALHQAVCYFTDKKQNLESEMKKYLDDIKKPILAFPLSNFQETSTKDISVSKTIYSTLKISLDKIRNTPAIGKDANLVCNLISFLYPDRIPVSLLQTIVNKIKNSDEIIPDSVFCLIGDNSLYKLKDGIISIHRLVQEAIRFDLDDKEEIIGLLVKSFTEMIESKEMSLEEIVFLEQLWSHMKHEELVERHPGFAEQIYYFYRRGGRYIEADEFCSKSLEILNSVLGERNRWTLKMRFWKAHHLKPNEANQLLKEVYRMQKQELGDNPSPNPADEKECLHTALKIASSYRKQKQFDIALSWLQITLTHKHSMQEDDNALIYVNIENAICIAGKGMYEEAEGILSTILASTNGNITEPVYQKAKFSLAFVLSDQKKYDLALEEFLSLLEIQNKHLGKKHSLIFRTKSMISRIYDSLGNFQQSLEIAKEVYEKNRERYGDRDERTTHTKNFIDNLSAKMKYENL